ncbi:MAG: hydrogenase maturation protease [Deinococcota bacterium]
MKAEAVIAKPDVSSVQLELLPTGYLHISAEVAATYFPSDSLIAMMRDGELWLLPVANRSSGGLLLKHRNAHGDRSVLIWEVLPENTIARLYTATWDNNAKTLRISLND